jgi:hypothetical protein
MLQPESSSSETLFRICVANAAHVGGALMAQLIRQTQGELASRDAKGSSEHSPAGAALRLLLQHEPALVKAYPAALQEIFAANSAGLAPGELLRAAPSVQVPAPVALSPAQQTALQATDALLAQLNALASAAQGMSGVQPECNPLRPENYIRALHSVVAESGVPASVRQAWMEHMLVLLGGKLVEVYQRALDELRYQDSVSAADGAGGGDPVQCSVALEVQEVQEPPPAGRASCFAPGARDQGA